MDKTLFEVSIFADNTLFEVSTFETIWGQLD